MLGLSLHLGQRYNQPNFNYLDNSSLRAALTEAANTGLVLAPGAPGVEENWLRGVRQGPLASGVTGATYARSGTRAGLDPANLFFDNLIRSSDNLQAGGWAAVDGATITSAIAGTLSSTLGSRIQQLATTVAGSTNTVSATLSGSGTVNLRNRDGSGAFGGTNLSVVLTSTPTRYSVTRTSADNGTTLVIENQSGVAVTNLQIRAGQIVQGNVPGPYIPNPSTTLSASQVRREAGRGVRVFGAGTNILRASEDFAAANWALDNSGAFNPIVTANFGVAPDGTMTADRIQLNKTGGVFSRILQSATVSLGTYTFSVWLRNNTAGTANVGLRIAGDSGVNLAVTQAWQRFAVTLVAPGTNADAQILLWDGIIGNDETADILAWGAQVEASAFATDYIPNASTTVSASAGADNLQIAASSLPSSGPIVFIADLPAQTLPLANARLFDHNSSLGLSMIGPTDVTALGPAAPTVTGLTSGAARRAAMLYTPSGATRLSVNGSAVVVGSDTAIASITNPVFLGNRASLLNALGGSLGIFAAYPGNPSDAQLQAMSAL